MAAASGSGPGEDGKLAEAAGGSDAVASQEGPFTVVPLSWCEHVASVTSVPAGVIDVKAPCVDCGDTSENWCCLVCYKVFCGRYVKEHMVQHGEASGHAFVLSFSDLSAWCYPCDSYVHHESLIPAKTAAHISKFGYPPSGSS